MTKSSRMVFLPSRSLYYHLYHLPSLRAFLIALAYRHADFTEKETDRNSISKNTQKPFRAANCVWKGFLYKASRIFPLSFRLSEKAAITEIIAFVVCS